MKSWLRGGIIAIAVSFLLLIADIIKLLSADLFGGLGAFALAMAAGDVISYMFYSFPAGILAGWLIGKLKIKTEKVNMSFLSYLILSLISLILFFWFYEIAYNSKFGFVTKFNYIPFLILFVILTVEYFNTKARKSAIILSSIFVLLVGLTFTAIPCKTTNLFCKFDFCRTGTYYDRTLGKCLINVENCYHISGDYDRHDHCINNVNGKILCDYRLKKCVENVHYCIDDNYCRYNINGKTVCYNWVYDEGAENMVCVEPENENPPGVSADSDTYDFSDPESVALYEKIQSFR